MFDSKYKELGHLAFPAYTGLRVMMMPVVFGDIHSVPWTLGKWRRTVGDLFAMVDESELGRVGYVTIDEKIVHPGETQRRPGMHVDGNVDGEKHSAVRGWASTPRPWASRSGGMIVASSKEGCRAWDGTFMGFPDSEGGCEHMRGQCGEGELLKAGVAYWMGSSCVHESVAMERLTSRQFVRLSMPSEAPWYQGYTPNPLGVKPAGPILPRRDSFMDWDKKAA